LFGLFGIEEINAVTNVTKNSIAAAYIEGRHKFCTYWIMPAWQAMTVKRSLIFYKGYQFQTACVEMSEKIRTDINSVKVYK